VARTAKQRAALRKAQLASARKRKILAKSSKKLRRKRRGIMEYVDRKGRGTGFATNRPARTNWGAMRNARKASRYNKRLGKKMKRAGVSRTGYYGSG